MFLTLSTCVSDSDGSLTFFHSNFDSADQLEVKEVRNKYSLTEQPCCAETVLSYHVGRIANGGRIPLLDFFPFLELIASPKTSHLRSSSKFKKRKSSSNFLTQSKEILNELRRIAFPQYSTSVVS